MVSTFEDAYKTIVSELNDSLSKIDEGDVEYLGERILESKNIFVVGAGRVGLMLKSFAMRLLHLGFKSNVVGSITCPPIGAHDLLIVASSSGETATIREVVGKANRMDAEIIAITANLDSAIARLATGVLFLAAPSTLQTSEKETLRSKQPMKTLFEQSLFIVLESVVLLLMTKTDQSADDMAMRHTNLE
jgi:6-phospho-3-hexuloisomerase